MKKIFFILIVSIALFSSVLSYYFHHYSNTNFLGLSDEFLTKIFRGVIKKGQDKDKSKEFLFIDVSQDIATIASKQNISEGKIIITDREKLTKFVERLASIEYDYRYFLCDIRFDLASDSLIDKRLEKALYNAKKTIFPSHQGVKNIFPALPTASTDYTRVGRYLLKYPLFQGQSNQGKSLPLVMYQTLYPKEKTDYLTHNALNIDYFLLSKDIDITKGNLETLATLIDEEDVDDATFKKLVKNKIIILGNFETDKHFTILDDEMAGGLILANIFLNLEAGNHKSNFLFLFLIFVGIFVSVYTWFIKLDMRWINAGVYIGGYFLWFLVWSFLIYTLIGQIIGFFWFASVCVIVKFWQTQLLLKQERQKTDNILYSILPKDIVEEIKTTNKVAPKRYENTSILFADVNGFSVTGKELVAQREALKENNKTPEGELIKLIDETFTEMDNICKEFGIERIKTIGDCYMGVAGIFKPHTHHAVHIILAALKIQQWMRKKYQENVAAKRHAWRVRLGIHSGNVVAGVIGKQRYAYDIWGDDVNIASRMESKGEVEKVNITIDTYELVKDYFEVIDRGEIELKNKGEGTKHAYFVERLKKDFAKDKDGLEANDKLKKEVGLIS